jgi:hypothetical protein
LLPKRLTRKPATGIEIIEPIGKASNTLPRPPSLRCNDCCMAGMREAQLAKHNPVKKNKELTAIRAALFGDIALIDKDCNMLLFYITLIPNC